MRGHLGIDTVVLCFLVRELPIVYSPMAPFTRTLGLERVLGWQDGSVSSLIRPGRSQLLWWRDAADKTDTDNIRLLPGEAQQLRDVLRRGGLILGQEDRYGTHLGGRVQRAGGAELALGR